MARGRPGGHGGCLLLVVDLRAALGEDVVTFVGWSYGARLGRWSSADRRIRRRCGCVVESQIAGFEAAFLAYADRCSQRESCVPFSDPRALFDRVVQPARNTPIPSGRPVGVPPANAETVAPALALGPSVNLLTVSGGGHTAFERSSCVAEHMILYLVELRVPGGHAC